MSILRPKSISFREAPSKVSTSLKTKSTSFYNRARVLPQLSETVYSAAFPGIVTNLISFLEPALLLPSTTNADSGRHSAEFSFSIVSQSDLSKKKKKRKRPEVRESRIFALNLPRGPRSLCSPKDERALETRLSSTIPTPPSPPSFNMYTGRRYSICRQGVQLQAEAAVFVSDVAKQQDVYSLRHSDVKIFMAVLSTRATFLLVTKFLNALAKACRNSG